MKSSKPLVSVVTPCYNGEAYLDAYFHSILSQTYAPLELVLINDGSTDRTDDIVRRYIPELEAKGIIFIYIIQGNKGQAAAMNSGLKKVTGKYLVWPDADDWLEPDSIEKRVAFLEENVSYRFVRSNAAFFDYETGEYVRRASVKENRFSSDIFEDLILEKTFCFCGCYMIRMDDFRDIYPDMTIFESPAGQNWQMIIPLAGRHRCGYIDEDLYHIAIRNDSHSRHLRTLEETVKRHLDLKAILIEAVRKSARTDTDYFSMIDIKYDRILFHTYMDAGVYDQARECCIRLKKRGQLTTEEMEKYLVRAHPFVFQLYRVKKFLCRPCRAFRQIK